MKFSEKRLSLFVNEQVFKTTKDGAGRNGKMTQLKSHLRAGRHKCQFLFQVLLLHSQVISPYIKLPIIGMPPYSCFGLPRVPFGNLGARYS